MTAESTIAPPARVIDISDKYTFEPELGRGSFSKVFLATEKSTGKHVAVKVIETASNETPDEKLKRERLINTETAVFRAISHEHIIKLVDVISTPRKTYIVLEYMPGGELFSLLYATGPFGEAQARRYLRQLVPAISYLHDRGIFHRDIKLDNILLGENDRIKIIDFGLSILTAPLVQSFGSNPQPTAAGSASFTTINPTRGASEQALCFERGGTVYYTAPEVLVDEAEVKQFGFALAPADVWSTGVVLYTMVTGGLPFIDPDPDDKISARKTVPLILKGKFTLPGNLSREVRDLITKILVVDPTKRLTLAGIERHPWYTAGDATGVEAGLANLSIH